MALVEVITLPTTAPDVRAAALALVRAQKKTPILAADTPGFVVNRLLVPALASAVALAGARVASVPDIDAAMRLGAGHPMGPLTLADYVGLDTLLAILRNWRAAHPAEPAFSVPPLLEALVKEGRLGRKSGAGFYAWSGDKPGEPIALPQ